MLDHATCRSIIFASILSFACGACATAKGPRPERQILGLTQSDGSASVSATATPGKRYQLQKAHHLLDPKWQNIGEPVTATGDSLTVTDDNATDSSAFYRIIPLD